MGKKKIKKKVEIKHHVLIPKHTVVGEKERKQLLEKYQVGIKELPKILASDPALQNLDVKPGDIVKIIRNSPLVGQTVYYRGVING